MGGAGEPVLQAITGGQLQRLPAFLCHFFVMFPGLFMREFAEVRHPRARGRNNSYKMKPFYKLATPPRTWAQRKNLTVPKSTVSDTPAHVGATDQLFETFQKAERHPRARGRNPGL